MSELDKYVSAVAAIVRDNSPDEILVRSIKGSSPRAIFIQWEPDAECLRSGGRVLFATYVEGRARQPEREQAALFLGEMQNRRAA